MLPSFEKILAAEDDPEEEPFLLEVRADPPTSAPGETFLVRVVVKNRSKRELRDVSVRLHIAGPAVLLARPSATIERFEPRTEYEIMFDLKRTGIAPIHLVVLLQRTSAGESLTERSTHVRVEAQD